MADSRENSPAFRKSSRFRPALRITAFLVIQAFLCLDLAWASGPGGLPTLRAPASREGPVASGLEERLKKSSEQRPGETAPLLARTASLVPRQADGQEAAVVRFPPVEAAGHAASAGLAGLFPGRKRAGLLSGWRQWSAVAMLLLGFHLAAPAWGGQAGAFAASPRLADGRNFAQRVVVNDRSGGQRRWVGRRPLRQLGQRLRQRAQDRPRLATRGRLFSHSRPGLFRLRSAQPAAPVYRGPVQPPITEKIQESARQAEDERIQAQRAKEEAAAKALQAQTERMEKEQRELAAMAERLREEIKPLRKMVEDLQKMPPVLQQEIEKLKGQLQQAGQVVKELEARRSGLRNDVSELEQERARLAGEVKEATGDLARLQAEAQKPAAAARGSRTTALGPAAPRQSRAAPAIGAAQPFGWLPFIYGALAGAGGAAAVGMGARAALGAARRRRNLKTPEPASLPEPADVRVREEAPPGQGISGPAAGAARQEEETTPKQEAPPTPPLQEQPTEGEVTVQDPFGTAEGWTEASTDGVTWSKIPRPEPARAPVQEQPPVAGTPLSLAQILQEFMRRYPKTAEELGDLKTSDELELYLKTTFEIAGVLSEEYAWLQQRLQEIRQAAGAGGGATTRPGAAAGLEEDEQGKLLDPGPVVARAWLAQMKSGMAPDWMQQLPLPSVAEVGDFLQARSGGERPETLQPWQQFIEVVDRLRTEEGWSGLPIGEKKAGIQDALEAAGVAAPAAGEAGAPVVSRLDALLEQAEQAAELAERFSAALAKMREVLKQALQEARAQRDELRRQHQEAMTATQKAVSLQHAIDTLHADLRETDAKAQGQAEGLKTVKAALAAAVAERDQARVELSQARADLGQTQSAAQRDLAQKETALQALQAQREAAQAALADAKTQLRDGERQLLQAQGALAAAKAEAAREQREKEEAKEALEQAQGEVRSLNEEKRDLSEALAASRRQSDGNLELMWLLTQQMEEQEREATDPALQARQEQLQARLGALQRTLDEVTAPEPAQPAAAPVQPAIAPRAAFQLLDADQQHQVRLAGNVAMDLAWVSRPSGRAMAAAMKKRGGVIQSGDRGMAFTVGEEGEELPLALAAAVADGVRSMPQGNEASRMMADALQRHWTDGASLALLKRFLERAPGDLDEADAELGQALRKMAQEIHDDLKGALGDQGATTLEFALWVGRRVFLVRAGDSRTYRMEQNGPLGQIGTDHRGSDRFLTQAFGVDISQMEIVSLPVETETVFLLASDGLTDAVSDGVIAQALRTPGDDDVYGQLGTLLSSVPNPPSDDVTAILIRVRPESGAEQAGLESLGAASPEAEGVRQAGARELLQRGFAQVIPHLRTDAAVGIGPTLVTEHWRALAQLAEASSALPPEIIQRLFIVTPDAHQWVALLSRDGLNAHSDPRTVVKRLEQVTAGQVRVLRYHANSRERADLKDAVQSLNLPMTVQPPAEELGPGSGWAQFLELLLTTLTGMDKNRLSSDGINLDELVRAIEIVASP